MVESSGKWEGKKNEIKREKGKMWWPTLVRSISKQMVSRSTRNIAATTARLKEDDHKEMAVTADILLSEENKQRLLERLPNAPPIGIKLRNSPHEATQAAVLICLCTDAQGEVSILYTRRSSRLSRHVRQISFPGGIKDPTDADFVDCALRETEEEIGLSRSRVEIWGTGKLLTPPYTAAIMPVVGSVENLNLNELSLNEDEVEEAFVIPIRELVTPSAIRHTQFKSGYSAPIFVVGQYRIWGITGFITNSFLQCLMPCRLERLRHRVKYVRPYRHHKHHHS